MARRKGTDRPRESPTERAKRRKAAESSGAPPSPLEQLDMVQAAVWRPNFLAALRDTCNVRMSCEAADVDRRTAYKHKRLDPSFADEWQEALDEAIELLEAAAFDRGLNVSDTLLIFLLKTHRPDKYNPVQKHEVSGPQGGPIQIGSTAERDKRLSELIIKAQRDGDSSGDPELEG